MRARLLARSGAFEEAQLVAREAIKIAARTDYLDLHAKSLMDLAEVLSLSGRRNEASATLEKALILYERKGVIAAAELIRRLLAEPHVTA